MSGSVETQLRWGGKLCIRLIAKATEISRAKFHCNRLTTVGYKTFKITRVLFFGTQCIQGHVTTLHTMWNSLTVCGTGHVEWYSYHAYSTSVTVSNGGRNATAHLLITPSAAASTRGGLRSADSTTVAVPRSLSSFGRQQLRSASRHQLLLIPRYRLRTFGRQPFAVAGPTFWNSLADELRTYSSDRFKLTSVFSGWEAFAVMRYINWWLTLKTAHSRRPARVRGTSYCHTSVWCSLLTLSDVILQHLLFHQAFLSWQC